MERSTLQRAVASVVARLGLLNRVLSVAGTWTFRRTRDGRPTFPYLRKREHRPFQILVYHRVNDWANPFFDTVPVHVFERQLTLLRRHFNVLPLPEMIDRKERNDIPPNAVSITFDDGYRDNFENAFPVLKMLGLPATIFLTTGPLVSQGPLWHDRMLDAFHQTRVTSWSLDGTIFPLRTLAEKRLAVRACHTMLRRSEPRSRDERIRLLTTELDVAEPPDHRVRKLTWQEIGEMAKNGMTFGAHTVTHPILTRVSRVEAVSEIVDSKATIEKHLGRPVDLFAYPNGGRADFNEDIKRALREAGLRCAVTTLPGTNDVLTDPYELRRDSIGESDPRTTVLRLAWYRLSS